MRVRVLNKKNGHAVIVRINDRINIQRVKPNFVIVLSRGSARALGMEIEGVGSVALYKPSRQALSHGEAAVASR